ncbi:hypothetical protein Trydic_g18308 [Trypoxylus dichotomus]
MCCGSMVRTDERPREEDAVSLTCNWAMVSRKHAWRIFTNKPKWFKKSAPSIDVAKVFDKVWHQGLLLKMYRASISKTMVRLVHSYLRKRAFKFKVEGQRFTVRTATAGAPQGSAISPFLFSIYTSDIPATAYVNLAMYADDVCIFARSRDVWIIDHCLQTASCWCLRIITPGFPGGILGHGHSSWITRTDNHHPEMEPSHFVEDAGSGTRYQSDLIMMFKARKSPHGRHKSSSLGTMGLIIGV